MEKIKRANETNKSDTNGSKRFKKNTIVQTNTLFNYFQSNPLTFSNKLGNEQTSLIKEITGKQILKENITISSKSTESCMKQNENTEQTSSGIESVEKTINVETKNFSLKFEKSLDDFLDRNDYNQVEDSLESQTSRSNSSNRKCPFYKRIESSFI
jgi:hypothetical protein